MKDNLLSDFPLSFVAMDIEGNGYWGEKEDIVELAIVYIENWEIRRQKTWLFKPLHKIIPVASKIHGIYNKDVENCPMFSPEEIEPWLRKIPVVAHNASTDVKLLKIKFPEWQPLNVIDTLKIAKKYFPNQISYKLQSLIQVANLQGEIDEVITHLDSTRKSPHSALYDSIAAFVLLRFLRLKSKESSSLTLFD